MSETNSEHNPALDPDFRSGFVAIMGRPNVGKSTLLNSILGQRLAAVTPKAQTTRRRFRGIFSDPEAKTQMIFIDTPGIHEPPVGKRLNEYCVEEAVDALEDADVILYVIDGSRRFDGGRPGSDEALVIRTIDKAMREHGLPLVVVINKLDLAQDDNGHNEAAIKEALNSLPVHTVLPLVAKTGKGQEQLLTVLREQLPQHPPYFPLDISSDSNMRLIAGELIQEQLFLKLGEEIPYECAVSIEDFKEPSEGRRKTEIAANIHVERNSQKQIVVGRKGAKIKELGIAARASLEDLLGQGVVLRLFVKVNPKWTRDFKRLEQLGYTLPEKLRKRANKRRPHA